MEDVPRRKHRRKLKSRPTWLSTEVLDRCVAAGEARLLEMVEKRRAEEELELLLSNLMIEDFAQPAHLPEISKERSIAISEAGRAAILAAYGEQDIQTSE